LQEPQARNEEEKRKSQKSDAPQSTTADFGGVGDIPTGARIAKSAGRRKNCSHEKRAGKTKSRFLILIEKSGFFGA
jgi:hypothetical protein